LTSGLKPSDATPVDEQGPKSKSKSKSKGSKGYGKQQEGFFSILKENEVGYSDEKATRRHRFEVRESQRFNVTNRLSYKTILTPATATHETFGLYKQYQTSVHKDRPDKISMTGFSRFLCRSPLLVSCFEGMTKLDVS
jgi:arginine-tRNA-protein transferase